MHSKNCRVRSQTQGFRPQIPVIFSRTTISFLLQALPPQHTGTPTCELTSQWKRVHAGPGRAHEGQAPPWESDNAPQRSGTPHRHTLTDNLGCTPPLLSLPSQHPYPAARGCQVALTPAIPSTSTPLPTPLALRKCQPFAGPEGTLPRGYRHGSRSPPPWCLTWSLGLLRQPKGGLARTLAQSSPSSIHWPPAAFPVVAPGAPRVGPISYRPAGPRRGGQRRARAPLAGSRLRGPGCLPAAHRTAARCLPRCFWLQSPHTQAYIPPPPPHPYHYV